MLTFVLLECLWLKFIFQSLYFSCVLFLLYLLIILGNNHMKEENYAAAVDCYSQAIELDPNNAVYYCNR